MTWTHDCRAGVRLNMKTERPHLKDRAKDKDGEKSVSYVTI